MDEPRYCSLAGCDIFSVGRAYDPELRQEDPFVESLLDALEEVSGDG